MEFLCIFIPAMIFCLVRRNLLGLQNEEENSVLNLILEYAIACVGINLLFQLFIILTYPKVIDISKYLNHNIVFAVKYLLSGTVVAVIIPCIEKCIRDNFELEINCPKYTFNFQGIFNTIRKLFDRTEVFLAKSKIQNALYFFVVLIVLIVCVINAMRIFDNALWVDEMFTVHNSKLDFTSMIDFVIKNGHSPLYYILAWIFNKLLLFPNDYHYFYRYHLLSFIPWMFILLIGLTFIRKNFGSIVSIIFLICSSLLYTSIYLATEVRMYSLCQLFILLFYLNVYLTYKNKRIKNFALISLFAILAIYSHYFALPVITILYFIMFIYFYTFDKKYIKHLTISLTVIIFSLIPWAIVCIQNKGGIISNYKLKDIIDATSAFNYIFSSAFSNILLLIFIVVAILTFNKYLNFLSIQKNEKIKIIKIKFSFDCFHNYKITWIISGILAVFGLIIGAIVFSHLFYSIIAKETLRYLLPSCIIIWLLLGILVNNLSKKLFTTIAIVLLICVSGMPRLLDSYNVEMRINNSHLQTIGLVRNIINENYVIITDHKHIAYDAMFYRYLNLSQNQVYLIQNHKIPKLKEGKNYLLILYKSINKNYENFINSNGYKLEKIKGDGRIGTIPIQIFQIVKK